MTRLPSARSGRSTAWSACPRRFYTDPHVVACTREALSRYGSGPPVAQPIREQLLAALAQ